MTNDGQFEMTVTRQPGTAILGLGGEIDVATAPQVHDALSGLIGEADKAVVVDLSEVSFIDSTGLGVLVGAEAQAREAGKSLRLVVTRPQIRKLLELTGLDEVFTVLSSTRDAVRT